MQSENLERKKCITKFKQAIYHIWHFSTKLQLSPNIQKVIKNIFICAIKRKCSWLLRINFFLKVSSFIASACIFIFSVHIFLSSNNGVMEFDILDEFESNDIDNEENSSSDSSDISLSELDALLDESLQNVKHEAPKPKEPQHEEKQKVILKGIF